MACALLVYSINLARILAYCSMLAVPAQKEQQSVEETLVQVNIITQSQGAKGAFEINGKQIKDYRPLIIQDFSSTGIVMDHSGNVMTFLGYRWVDILNRNPQVEVTTGTGQKWKGKLIGIDQTNSVAVIQTNGKLKKTPLCTGCEVKDGITVMSPIVRGPDLSQYQEAQILSVGRESAISDQSSWILALNHPFPEIGQPILTMDRRVLGFIAGQDPAIVYPIDQMIASANKILKTGGDIRAGWLGVLIVDTQPEKDAGIVIQTVEPGSPAQKAGLVAQDFLHKYDGKEIQNARQFIQRVEETPIGSKVNLEIIREGNPLNLTATIEARNTQQNIGRLSLDLYRALGFSPVEIPEETKSNEPQLRVGLEVTSLNPAKADKLKIHGQTGLLITEVVKQSRAERAGVCVDDVIVSLNGQRFTDPLSLASFLQNNGLSSQLILKILRKGAKRTITIQVPDQNR
jgi:S1-C subfamily serine protease